MRERNSTMLIKELRRERATKAKALVALAEKADFSDEDQAQSDDLSAAISALDARIARLEAANETAAASLKDDEDEDEKSDDEDEDGEKTLRRLSTKAVTPASPSIQKARAKAQKPGSNAIQYMLGSALMKLGESPRNAADAVMKAFGNTSVAKALVTTSGTGTGLVPIDYSTDFIENVYPDSVVRKAGPRIIRAPRGNLQMTRLATSTTTSWVPEVGPIVGTDPTFDGPVANVKKIVGQVDFSRDLLRRSLFAVEEIVTNDLREKMSVDTDIIYLRGASGVANTPTGLRFKTGVSVMTGTNVTDYRGVLSALNGARARMARDNIKMVNRVWFMHSAVQFFLASVVDGTGREVFPDILNVNPSLLGLPVFVSNQLPINLTGVVGGGTKGSEIMLVEMSEVIVADAIEVEFETSIEAPFMSGGALKSAWATDSMVIKAIAESDIILRRNPAVVVLPVDSWLVG